MPCSDRPKKHWINFEILVKDKTGADNSNMMGTFVNKKIGLKVVGIIS